VRRGLFSSLLIVALATAPAGAHGQETRPADLESIRAELNHIRTDLEAVKDQLGQVLRLLGQQRSAQNAPPTSVRTSVGDAPMLGRRDAPVTIVEFSDYQCPFCRRFFTTVFPTIKKDYIDTGKVRYVFRDFPIDQIHPQARKAAEAAHCAGEQGKYWEMHEVLYQNQAALGVPQLAEHARKLGLDATRFDECLASRRHAARVERGLADGAAAGVQGTPGFVVARTQAGDIVEGVALRGAQPVETFRRLIDQLLDQKEKR